MLNNVLFILLGAGLVTVGFLAAALAERIREPRQGGSPELTEHIRGSRDVIPGTRAQDKRGPRPIITIVESAEMPSTPTTTRNVTPSKAADLPAEMPSTPTITRASRAPRAEAKSSPGDEVVEALVGTGYKRTIATQATYACGDNERKTVEDWTRAALRRCGQAAS